MPRAAALVDARVDCAAVPRPDYTLRTLDTAAGVTVLWTTLLVSSLLGLVTSLAFYGYRVWRRRKVDAADRHDSYTTMSSG
jgi:hypothetical protein